MDVSLSLPGEIVEECFLFHHVPLGWRNEYMSLILCRWLWLIFLVSIFHATSVSEWFVDGIEELISFVLCTRIGLFTLNGGWRTKLPQELFKLSGIPKIKTLPEDQFNEQTSFLLNVFFSIRLRRWINIVPSDLLWALFLAEGPLLRCCWLGFFHNSWQCCYQGGCKETWNG